MEYFRYSLNEIDYLKEKDPVLGAKINEIGMIKREITKDPFVALISSIVSQQISTKAALTVWNRFKELVGEITPEHISKVSNEAIQGCGMSMKKVSYIKGIAENAIEIDFINLHNLEDDEIIKKLSSLRGVGVWTVEMLLIFSFNRLNILSYNDLAIRRGIMNVYGLDTLTKKEFEIYRERYSPYASVASLYLWHCSKR